MTTLYVLPTADTHCWDDDTLTDCWSFSRELLLQELAKAELRGREIGEKSWKDAVIDQLVILHIYQAKHDADPRLALKDAIDFHVQMALDRQVSSDAAALVQRGREAGEKA